MEPDPSPDSSNTIQDTQITSKDIDILLGVSKKGKKKKILYLLSKKVILAVATICTFIFFSFHYFGIV